MPTATIYHFPKRAIRRPVMVRPPLPMRYASHPHTTGSFGLLLAATLAAASLYLSGAIRVTRHDALYAGLLAAVWGIYFASGPLLRTPVLGPAVARVGQAFATACLAAFFVFVYWLILTH